MIAYWRRNGAGFCDHARRTGFLCVASEQSTAEPPGAAGAYWNPQRAGERNYRCERSLQCSGRGNQSGAASDGLRGTLRAARFFTSERQLAGQKPSPSDRLVALLVARAMAKLGRSNEVPHYSQDHLIRFSATDAYQPYPIWEIADPDMWHSKYSDGEFFEGKIVVVGASGSVLGDAITINNPISPEIKGPVMQLNVLAATMDHEFLRKLPVALDLVIVAVFGLLAWVLLGYVGRWWICLLSFLGLSVAYFLLAFLLYNFLGIFVPIVPPLLTLLACGFLGFIAQRIDKRSHGMVHG